MKTTLLLVSLTMLCVLAACQSATSLPPLTSALNDQFTLAPGQSVSIKKTDLTITFNAVLSDERCPSEIECAASGPVTVSLSVQQDGETASTITLETFTDQDGRAPAGPLEGIQDRVEMGDHVIQVLGVVPYPKNLSGIKASDYEVTLIVLGN